MKVFAFQSRVLRKRTAFLHHDGKWCRPRGATPTTHIFKLPLGLVGGMQADMRTSVENEWLCARILRGSINREADLACLLKAQVLFWMLAATDGHAKNFSIRILRQGRFQLTPLYDVLSIWPIIGAGPNRISWHDARLAMAVRGRSKHYLLKNIQRRHFNATAAQCGVGANAGPLIEDILAA